MKIHLSFLSLLFRIKTFYHIGIVAFLLIILYPAESYGFMWKKLETPKYTQSIKNSSFSCHDFLERYSLFFIDHRWHIFPQYKWNLCFTNGVEIRSRFILKYLHFMELSSLDYKGKRIPNYMVVIFQFEDAWQYLLGKRNINYLKKYYNASEVQQFHDYVTYAIPYVDHEPSLPISEDKLDEQYILPLIQILLGSYVETSRLDPNWKSSWHVFAHDNINETAARFFLREHLSGTRVPVDDDFRCLVYTNLFDMNQKELRKIMEWAQENATYPVAWQERVEATSLDELCRLWQQELQRLKRKEPSDGQKKLP